MSIGWNFPSSGGGHHDGFNHPGIETFAGTRFPSVAREVLQNSLDAAKQDSLDATKHEKVTVEFDVHSINKNEFPGHKELIDHMQACNQKDSTDKKAKTFFKNALKVLDSNKIPCLWITDFGTTGLQGNPDEQNNPWFAITKASGTSVKQSDTAGGSFGIGKYAPFVVSDLRTVFYSTKYTDNGKIVQRTQGKSILMSRSGGAGEWTTGTGFFGIRDKCRPLEGDSVPKLLRQKKEGTQICVTGFNGGNDWQEKIIAAVVVNFFYAIANGTLEVLIKNDANEEPTKINDQSLPEFFEKEEIKNQEGVGEAKIYYSITQGYDNERDMELPHLGHSKIWTRVEEGLPKQVALLRSTGMLITDEEKKLKRWPGYSDFAAVYICKSKKGNSLLRRMENPQHNSFEPERLLEEQAKGEKALDQLFKKVRGAIREFAMPSTSAPSDIDELSEYLPDQNPDEKIAGEGEERDLEGAPIYQLKPFKPYPLSDSGKDESGEYNGDENGENGGNGEGGNGESGKGGRNGDGRHQNNSPVEITKVRVLRTPDKDWRERIIMYTPMISGEIKISLNIAGDNQSEELPIQKVHSGGNLVSKGSHSVTTVATKGKRSSLKLTLVEPIKEAILITATQKQ